MELKEQKMTLESLESELSEIENPNSKRYVKLSGEIEKLKKEIYGNLTPWDRVTLARDSKRPRAQDYLELLFDNFCELHGDRRYGDDPSIIGGIAQYKGLAVTVIAQSKGKSLDENLKKNFGMASPEGYRKALRLAKQAEKFKRPIITFVDTPGAFPGKGAEERGQAEAIATCLYEFSTLEVPIICIVLSEGGSGGALALSVADRIAMLENAVYSILSPEGFASILWKDERRAKEASDYMKLTSYDLKDAQVVDEIIEEPIEGAHSDLNLVSSRIEKYIDSSLDELMRKKTTNLLKERYDKFRKIGVLN